MQNILCFGDSNTFGYIPGGGRYPRHVRWTGRLQMRLGQGWHVTEEGMCGRTTVWDDPIDSMRCGIRYLPIVLNSHQPLDMAVVSLGTNDCKSIFCAPPDVIAMGLRRVIRCILQHPYDIGAAPRIVIVSPIHIGDMEKSAMHPAFDGSSAEKSRRLAPLFRDAALERGCLFLDAAQIAAPSERDHLHMEPEGHAALADALAKLILNAPGL